MTYLFRVWGTVPDVNDLPDEITGKDLPYGWQVKAEVRRDDRHFIWELVTKIRPNVGEILPRIGRDGVDVICLVSQPEEGSIIGKSPGYELVTPSPSK